MHKLTLDDVLKLFPSDYGNRATTGRIPIEWFNEHEKELRELFRERGDYAAFYRGPRMSNRVGMRGGSRDSNPGRTRRCDATHVLMYRI